jgi:hypothetical protein
LGAREFVGEFVYSGALLAVAAPVVVLKALIAQCAGLALAARAKRLCALRSKLRTCRRELSLALERRGTFAKRLLGQRLQLAEGNPVPRGLGPISVAVASPSRRTGSGAR